MWDRSGQTTDMGYVLVLSTDDKVDIIFSNFIECQILWIRFRWSNDMILKVLRFVEFSGQIKSEKNVTITVLQKQLLRKLYISCIAGVYLWENKTPEQYQQIKYSWPRHACMYGNVYLVWNYQSMGYCFTSYDVFMMTSSNGNIFHVTGPLCGEFTGDR